MKSGKDPVIGPVVQGLRNQNHFVPYLETFHGEIARLWGVGRKNRLYLEDGLVLYRRRVIDGKEHNQIVLPSSLRDRVLRALHDDIGHLERHRTLDLVHQRFFWPIP